MERIEEALMRHHKLSRAQLDALWTYVSHKGEKKVSRKRMSEAPSGGGQRSKLKRGFGSDAPSPRPKKKSRKT
jgi:hypothetical protein